MMIRTFTTAALCLGLTAPAFADDFFHHASDRIHDTANSTEDQVRHDENVVRHDEVRAHDARERARRTDDTVKADEAKARVERDKIDMSAHEAAAKTRGVVHRTHRTHVEMRDDADRRLDHADKKLHD